MATNSVTFDVDSPVTKALFFGKSAERNRLNSYSEKPLEVFPGIFSNDKLYLRFIDVLTRDLSARFEPNVDSLGRVSGNGVRTNFLGSRHVGGYSMFPATYPMMSNEYLRSQADLTNKFESQTHENIFRAIVRLCFSDLEPQKLPLRKNSSSVAPFFTKNMSEKISLATFSLEKAALAGNMMSKGDYITPWTEMYIGGAYYGVYRDQSTDAIKLEGDTFTAKDRPVGDLEFSTSGGRSGSFKPASKAFGPEIDFKVPNGFFRTRRRNAAGGGLGINATQMPVAHAVRKKMYGEYAYTFHHTTRDSIRQDLRKAHLLIAGDVSNHDWYWPHFAHDAMEAELEAMNYSEWFVKLFRTISKLPIFVAGVGPDIPNILLGDWRSPSNTGGLSSGEAMTDIKGSIWMTFCYFILQATHTYPSILKTCETFEGALSTMDRYLKGQLPIALKDKSDDGIMIWTDRTLLPAALKLQRRMQEGDLSISNYMIIQYEHGGAFLGSIIMYPGDKNPAKLDLIGNIVSLVGNQFSPEYGVFNGHGDRSKAKRPYGGLAWDTMRQNYGSSPIYDDVVDLIEHHWGKVYGYSYANFRREWLIADKKALASAISTNGVAGLNDLTPADIEVLIDPARADWKYSEEDLTPGLKDMMFKGLSLETVEPYFRAATNQ